MSNSEPSTSFISSTKQTLDEMEDGQIEKKFKEESESENESQVEDENQCFIENLPTEMLMKILKYLNVKSIAVSRLMNRRWNVIAREKLKSRDDVEIVFNCKYPENGTLRIGANILGATLENFIICFADSKETPLFTRFRYNNVSVSVFKHVDWIKFVSDFGKSVKCLKLVVETNYGLNNINKMAEQLRNVLLIQLPNLQEFGLKFQWNHFSSPDSSEIQLFPKTTTGNGSKKETSGAVSLPHLKILYLDDSSFSEHTALVTDLLRVSLNLQKIDLFEQFILFTFESFHLLQSLGKLGCLQDASITLTSDFLSKIKENIKTPLEFKLNRLDLWIDDDIMDLEPEGSVFICNLFESSKDTLTKLTTSPLEFIQNVELPILTKLTNLCCYDDGSWSFPLLPSGIKLMDIFPVLHSLELSAAWTTIFTQENCDTVYSDTLEALCFSNVRINQHIDETMIAEISVMFPNLKQLEVLYMHSDYSRLNNFPQVGTAIWTHLKKLQYLKLQVLADGPDNIFPAFDSCITGFSESYCKSLCHLLVADKLWRKCGAPIKASQSEMNAERKYPSILDLKDLKYFEIDVLCCYPEDELEPDLTRIGPTWISSDCAFKLMNNAIFEVKKRVRPFNPDFDEI